MKVRNFEFKARAENLARLEQKLIELKPQTVLIKKDGIEKEIICTEDHKFYTNNRGWVEAKDLVSDDDIKNI